MKYHATPYNEDSELKKKYELKSKEDEVLCNVASKGKRFANYILDGIFIGIWSFIFGIFLGIVLLFFPESSILEGDTRLLEYLLGFTAAMIYYVSLESLTGRTFAKYITKTKVITENGGKPSFGTIFIRALCRFVPFEPFSFLGSKDTGWHDRWSKTLVVNE